MFGIRLVFVEPGHSRKSDSQFKISIASALPLLVTVGMQAVVSNTLCTVITSP